MSESEEERRLRKEKKREAARRAAEAEAVKKDAAAAAIAPSSNAEGNTETEEERRLRKEKKRALREAQKKKEEEEAAAEKREPLKRSKEEREEARRLRKEKAERSGGEKDNREGHHHHRDEEATSTGDANKTAASSSLSPSRGREARGETTAGVSDKNAELLKAIQQENAAVVVARSPKARASTAVTRAEDGTSAAAVAETEEERAARKQAEREERRRARHAAKVAAAAAANGNGGDEANKDASAGDGSPSAGPSPTTAFDPSELQRQAYRAQFQKDLTRATALRRLVDFDSSGGVVLDVAPQTAYDLYIRDFGQSGREQMAVQAPPEEERLDVATQAERGKLRHKNAQAPDDLGLCPEEEAERQYFQMRNSALLRSGRADAAAGAGGGAQANDEDDNDNGGESGNTNASNSKKGGSKKSMHSVDAALLERFLTHTLPVMSAVLDENNATATGNAAAAAAAAATTTGADGKPKSSTAFSSVYTTFCWRGTRNRPLVQVLLNPSNPRQLLALHGPHDESGPSPTLDAYRSVLLLWNVHDNVTPERVLVSFSAVTSTCVSPSRPHLFYGGTEDGNVCVWSLREPDRLHLPAGRYEKVVFHLPSYSTSWQADGHDAPVRQVRVAGYNAKPVSGSNATRRDEHEQLVSMDERGLVCYWVVSDKDSAGKTATVSENDYGQHPFATVRLCLAKGSSSGAMLLLQGGGDGDDGDVGGAAGVASSAAGASGVGYAAALTGNFDFSPADTTQLILTAPQGIVRRSRFGGIASPAVYGAACATYGIPGEEQLKRTAIAVPCCVQYSVSDGRWFVAGYEDGTVRLYVTPEAAPKLTVEVGCHPIIAVRCSGMTPWVVWALDESGEVHMLDFAHHSRQAPRLSHVLTQPDTGVCTCVDLSAKDEKADQRVLAAGFEKGMVQLHMLDTQRLRVANSERDEHWI